MLSLNFTGFDSNQVMCVTTNAAVMIVDFYSTTQPTWEVHYVESYYYVPRTFWQGKLDDVKTKLDSIFNR